MALAELLLDLKELLQKPDENADAIVKLLEQHADLAEFEVARAFAGRAVEVGVERRLKNVDPKERLAAVRSLSGLFPRAPAARLLRKMVKDPSRSVSAAARAGVRRLKLADVALPDSRWTPDREAPLVPGGWNPSGWWAGLFGRSSKPPPKVSLPKLSSRAEVAALVGVTEEELTAFMRPGSASGSGYVEFDVPKRSGGTRRIAAPRAKLRAAQRALLDQVLSKIPLHGAAHGFAFDRSVVTNAQLHVGATIVVKVDLEEFFPSVHYRRVRGLFEAYGYNTEVASTLAGLTTWRAKLPDGRVAWPGCLPQGAPTSPAIANIVCRRLDARLTALCARFGATYTRYADDLAFSFQKRPERLGRFLWWVNSICQQEGFSENDGKRRVMRSGGRRMVTGLVVNQKVSIPREDRRRFKAILHNVKKHGLESQARGREDFKSWLEGYASWVRMVHPELGLKWQREVKALTRGQG